MAESVDFNPKNANSVSMALVSLARNMKVASLLKTSLLILLYLFKPVGTSIFYYNSVLEPVCNRRRMCPPPDSICTEDSPCWPSSVWVVSEPKQNGRQ
jgi:hypothetical protein